MGNEAVSMQRRAGYRAIGSACYRLTMSLSVDLAHELQSPGAFGFAALLLPLSPHLYIAAFICTAAKRVFQRQVCMQAPTLPALQHGALVFASLLLLPPLLLPLLLWQCSPNPIKPVKLGWWTFMQQPPCDTTGMGKGWIALAIPNQCRSWGKSGGGWREIFQC